MQYTTNTLDAELIAPPPYDEIYTEYLQYRICLAQQEPERANNFAATFNRVYNEYVRFIAETVDPGNGMAEKAGYYISAYQLARKYGETRSEEEWIGSMRGMSIDSRGDWYYGKDRVMALSGAASSGQGIKLDLSGWDEEKKAAVVQEVYDAVIAKLREEELPILGEVGADKSIATEDLPVGYSVKYEYEDGSTADIFTVEE